MAIDMERIGSEAASYARLAQPRSFIGAAAQRATKALARHNRTSWENSDLARWEGEGGADNPRAATPKTLRKLITLKSALSGLLVKIKGERLE